MNHFSFRNFPEIYGNVLACGWFWRMRAHNHSGTCWYLRMVFHRWWRPVLSLVMTNFWGLLNCFSLDESLGERELEGEWSVTRNFYDFWSRKRMWTVLYWVWLLLGNSKGGELYRLFMEGGWLCIQYHQLGSKKTITFPRGLVSR